MGDASRKSAEIGNSEGHGQLTNPLCVVPDFSVPPWNDAVLVTPRHGVRHARNRAMVTKKVYETKKTILITHAEEYMGCRKSNLPYNVMLASTELEPKWKLPYEVEMFDGMCCLITHKVCVDAHLANGRMGMLEKFSCKKPMKTCENSVRH